MTERHCEVNAIRHGGVYRRIAQIYKFKKKEPNGCPCPYGSWSRFSGVNWSGPGSCRCWEEATFGMLAYGIQEGPWFWWPVPTVDMAGGRLPPSKDPTGGSVWE